MMSDTKTYNGKKYKLQKFNGESKTPCNLCDLKDECFACENVPNCFSKGNTNFYFRKVISL